MRPGCAPAEVPEGALTTSQAFNPWPVSQAVNESDKREKGSNGPPGLAAASVVSDRRDVGLGAMPACEATK